MKEMNRTAMAETAAVAIQIAIIAVQSIQRTWTNIAMTGTHRQIPANGMGEPYMVILVRHNRKTLVYPDPDILPSNSISGETVETINRTLQNNEVVAI